MVSTIIWLVVFARPRPEVRLGPLMNERRRVGADMVYPNRFNDAKALAKGDRVVWHFGGPKRSAPFAQHLVYAGCVKDQARPLIPADAVNYRTLLDLTCAMFRDFHPVSPLLELQGIMFYELFDPPPEVGPLPTPPLKPFSAPRRGPMPGDNFIPLLPGHAAYGYLDTWWHRVVPRGSCEHS